MADDVSKLLSTSLLVSSSLFAKLTPAQQTEILVSAAGKPIIFVASFAELRNKRNIVSKLVNGEDVTTELEFNEIALSDKEKVTLAAIRPILDRIRGASGKYPWIVRTAPNEAKCKTMRFEKEYSREAIHRDGYTMSDKQAKRIWDAASAFWGGIVESPEVFSGRYDGYARTVTIYRDYISVGCQTVNRYEVEYIAEHYGWEPNVNLEIATTKNK